MVDQRRREQRVQLHARRATLCVAALALTLIADFDEIGVDNVTEADGAHVAGAAFRVPNEN